MWYFIFLFPYTLYVHLMPSVLHVQDRTASCYCFLSHILYVALQITFFFSNCFEQFYTENFYALSNFLRDIPKNRISKSKGTNFLYGAYPSVLKFLSWDASTGYRTDNAVLCQHLAGTGRSLTEWWKMPPCFNLHCFDYKWIFSGFPYVC